MLANIGSTPSCSMSRQLVFIGCNHSCKQTKQATQALIQEMKDLKVAINTSEIQDVPAAMVQLQRITRLSHGIESSMRAVKAFTETSINYLNKAEKLLPACVDGFDLDNDKVLQVDQFVVDICEKHSDAVISRKLAFLRLREKLLNKLSSLEYERAALLSLYQESQLKSKSSQEHLIRFLQKKVR